MIMKKVVFALATAVLSTAFISCRTETDASTQQENQNSENGTTPTEEMAMANPSETNTQQFLYVTAPSGLSLREFGNLQSEKVAKMPYGTKVRVIKAENKPTMTVAGIKGGMNEVEFNHKKGFAFNGYLSKYFPPELNITVKGYATELQQLFPEVTYTETNGGTVTNPSNTETISLPNAQWHEAFYIAQRLFDFPKEFEFPNPNGQKSQIIPDGMPKKGIWTSQLEISRNNDGLEQIVYSYGSKKFDSRVVISRDNEVMKISKTETIK
jgi:hypothetical protein